MKRNVAFEPTALAQLQEWLRADPKLALRIFALLDDIQRTPFNGIGKPEPLRHQFAGAWRRRIDHEHRLVYKVEAEQIIIVSCRFHYT